MTRYRVLLLAVGFWAASFCAAGSAARADTRGSIVGTVTMVTGASIDIQSNHQIVRFVLANPFFAVYLSDRKTLVPLAALRNGMSVHIAYVDVSNTTRRAIEIDVLSPM